MAEVNLLTGEKKKSFLKNYASLLAKVNLVATVVFFVTALAFTALFVVNQRALTEVQERENKVKNAVQALAATEAQYVFLKDRAQKATGIFNSRDLLVKLDKLTVALSSEEKGTINLERVEISTGKATIAASTDSFSSLNSVLTALGGLDFYSKGTLSSLSFASTGGLSFEADFSQ